MMGASAGDTCSLLVVHWREAASGVGPGLGGTALSLSVEGVGG